MTNITKLGLNEALTIQGQSDWDRVRSAPDVQDDDEDGFDWANAVHVPQPGKAVLSIRLDADVLAYFKGGGKGYQTRINAVLRSYVKAHEKGA